MDKNDWIKTEHSLPMTGLRVLCQFERRNGFDKEVYLEILRKTDDNQWVSVYGVCAGTVTHWQYLPELAN